MLWWTIRQLRSGKIEVRRRAAARLGKARAPRAMGALIAVFTDHSWLGRDVREDAIAALNCIDPRWRESPTAVETIRKLEGQLASADEREVENAARALGQIADTRSLDPLLAALQRGAATGKVAWALGQLGDARAVRPLMTMLERCRDWALRDARPWRPPDLSREQQIQAALACIRDLHALKEHTARPDRPTTDGSVDALLADLEAQAPAVRASAVDALAQLRPANAVEPLARILLDPVADVRRRAVEALRQSGDPRAVPALVEAVRSNREPSVRFASIEALADLQDRQAVPALINVLRSDRDVNLRRLAAGTIGKLGSEEAVTALVAALRSDPQGVVRFQTVKALIDLRPPQIVPTLVGTLTLERDPAVKVAILEALGELRDRGAVPAILETLNSAGDAEVRRAAADALGKLGDPGATPVLFETLRGATRDGISPLIVAAARALGRLGPDSVVSFLVQQYRAAGQRLESEQRGAYGAACCAATGLRAVLEAGAASVSEVDLRDVVRLEPEYLSAFRDGDPGCAGDYPHTDISHERQLARQELIRRGLKA